ncbi:hypothetical protein AA12717_1076 [Gluconacetobacter sacchari DSM 12717]|uniref:Uncharacterized protein n=2 Tax=Gluconacetobacter sacchari TaxID=92759 RepID=A0A7W4IH27_9PROT|nr:hypothetical protein [Gluconacetobacter sacchari]MBB2162713.1 hypothetical protein [Gluconacetobacter sacchari]GBQ22055.1 hypothetical protein AA12717_1076 [Gluconacetobacter sacchari DSM 12717]
MYALARIPDFQGLIHTANLADLPIFKLDDAALKADDIQGIVKEKAVKNIESFDVIYEAIASKIEMLSSNDCRI